MMDVKKLILVFGAFVLVIVLGVLVVSCNSNKCFAGNSTKESVITTLSPTAFNTALKSGEYKLIDIRTAEEFNSGHIEGAANSDFYKTANFSNYLDSLDKNNKYLIYCRTGHRSSQALNIMRAKGFKNVSDMQGGINAWAASNFPTI
jgi:rhodanese-related sulfurtransferase